MQLGRVEEAVVSYERTLHIRPDRVVACHSLANALAHLGRIEQALAAYRRAVTLDPNCAELHNNLGGLLRACGRLDEAAACFRRALGARSARGGSARQLGTGAKAAEPAAGGAGELPASARAQAQL